MSFVRFLLDKNVLNPTDLVDGLQPYLDPSTQQVPICQWLVSSGKFDGPGLAALLDWFLAETAPVAPVAVRALAPMDTWAPHFTVADAGGREDYCAALDDVSRAELSSGLAQWSPGLAASNLRDVFRAFHTYKGCARYIRAEISERLMHESEELIGASRRGLEKLDAAEFQSLSALNIRTIDILWALRASIEAHGSEESFWKRADARADLLAHLAALRAIKSKMEKQSPRA